MALRENHAKVSRDGQWIICGRCSESGQRTCGERLARIVTSQGQRAIMMPPGYAPREEDGVLVLTPHARRRQERGQDIRARGPRVPGTPPGSVNLSSVIMTSTGPLDTLPSEEALGHAYNTAGTILLPVTIRCPMCRLVQHIA